MTNSISSTAVEVTKNILDTVIMALWQPMSNPTTWQFNLILCQVVMTKTLTGYMMLWFMSRCLNKDILMSYLHSKRHYW